MGGGLNLSDDVGTNPNGYRLPINAIGYQIALEDDF